MNRRAFLRLTAALGAGSLVGTVSRSAGAQVGSWDPYGKIVAPDANGIRLPPGFTSRVIARSGQPVAGTGYIWHGAPDGGACFGRRDGSWIYVSNAELESGRGGVGAIRIAPSGEILDAYSILTGTSRNCAGGRTPWGTWLSCEETGSGQVYECNPYVAGPGVLRSALGTFNHEAAAVDPSTGEVYLSEDARDGRLYKFVPSNPGSLESGQLFAARLDNGVVSWLPAASAGPDRNTRTTEFDGGEGLWVSDGRLFFTTKGDIKVWEMVLATGRMRVMYDGVVTPGRSLNAVDNVVVHEPSGDLFVCEDGGNMELGILSTIDDSGPIAFMRVTGQGKSELTGVAFSPDHSRLYVSSQRGTDGNGITYEIAGPFRHVAAYRAAAAETIASADTPALRLG